MQALRAEIDMLDAQMAQLARNTHPDEQRRLTAQHLRDARGTLTRMHAMELEMVDRVRRGRVVSDTGLRERQELLARQSAMVLAMLDQAIEHAQGGCR